MRVNKKQAFTILLLFAASLLFVLPIYVAKAQTATVSVSPQENTVSVGQTFTVHIQISDVQNLYAVDIALTWNITMLELDGNQSFVGVTNGILNTPVLVAQDTADQSIGEYHLVATSENPAGPFTGSATVATLTFKVTSAGQSQLALNPQLASYPQSGETSQPINANVVNGSVSTSSSTASPSESPTTSTSSSPSSSPSTSSTPKVPEFPSLAILLLLVLIRLVLLMPKLRKHFFRRTSSTQGFAL